MAVAGGVGELSTCQRPGEGEANFGELSKAQREIQLLEYS